MTDRRDEIAGVDDGTHAGQRQHRDWKVVCPGRLERDRPGRAGVQPRGSPAPWPRLARTAGRMSATAGSERRIAHLDMDAFYASVELLRYPQLAGQPVVIGGRRSGGGGHATAGFERLADYPGRGGVTAATYAPREFARHSCMAPMPAPRLSPQPLRT